MFQIVQVPVPASSLFVDLQMLKTNHANGNAIQLIDLSRRVALFKIDSGGSGMSETGLPPVGLFVFKPGRQLGLSC